MSTKKRGAKRSNKCLVPSPSSALSSSASASLSVGETAEKKPRPLVARLFVQDDQFDSEWIQANRLKLSIPSTVTRANQVPISFRSTTDLLESLVLPLDHGQLTSNGTKFGWIQLLTEATTSCLLRDIVGIVIEFYPLEFTVWMTMARSDPPEMRHQFHIMEVVSYAHRYPTESLSLVKWLSNDNFISDDIVYSAGAWVNYDPWLESHEVKNWPFHRASSTTIVGRVRDTEFARELGASPSLPSFVDYVFRTRAPWLTLTIPLLRFLRNTNVLKLHLRPPPSTESVYCSERPTLGYYLTELSRETLKNLIHWNKHDILRWMIHQMDYPVVEWIHLGVSLRYGGMGMGSTQKELSRARFFKDLVSFTDSAVHIDYAETWKLLDKSGVVSELIYDKTLYVATVLSKAIAELERGETHGHYYTWVYGELRYPITKTPSELFAEYCSGHDPKSIHEAALPVSPNGDE
jgi:hypothetical protein